MTFSKNTDPDKIIQFQNEHERMFCFYKKSRNDVLFSSILVAYKYNENFRNIYTK